MAENELRLGADGYVDMGELPDVDPELALESHAMLALRDLFLSTPAPQPDARTWDDIMGRVFDDAALSDDALVPDQAVDDGPFVDADGDDATEGYLDDFDDVDDDAAIAAIDALHDLDDDDPGADLDAGDAVDLGGLDLGDPALDGPAVDGPVFDAPAFDDAGFDDLGFDGPDLDGPVPTGSGFDSHDGAGADDGLDGQSDGSEP